LMNPSASKETLQECTTLAALLTAPQDLCEAHIRDLETWCSFSYKSEFRLGHSLPFFQCSLSPHMTLTRGLGNCQLICISLTGILIVEWIPLAPNTRIKSHHQYLALNAWTNFKSLSGQLFSGHNNTAPGYYNGSPKWTKVYNQSGFANTQRRLFREEKYKFFIGKIQAISGNHRKPDTQDFKSKTRV
jgi:hypothetical protein